VKGGEMDGFEDRVEERLELRLLAENRVSEAEIKRNDIW